MSSIRIQSIEMFRRTSFKEILFLTFLAYERNGVRALGLCSGTVVGINHGFKVKVMVEGINNESIKYGH